MRWIYRAGTDIIRTMEVTVFPGRLAGTPALPPSKSHIIRLLLASALCPEGESTLIEGFSDCGDVSAALSCLKALGSGAAAEEGGLRVFGIKSGGAAGVLNCGESASVLRFLLPVCSALAGPEGLEITGSEGLAARPHGPLLKALRSGGALIEGDSLPLRVRGGLKPGEFVLPGNISSQYFSGLLFALPLLDGESALRFAGCPVSEPYIEMTLDVLRDFGIEAAALEDGWLVPGGQKYGSPGRIRAERDWSAAAFWLAAGVLGSQVKLRGLDPLSKQADKEAQALFSKIGGAIDVSSCPDLMPALAAAAAASGGKTTRISGAGRLRFKESDRLSAMKDLINGLGGMAYETEDGLTIEGRSLRGGRADGRNDHRVVMSAAVLALSCEGPVSISCAEAAGKSYPGFWEDLKALGGRINVT